MQPTRAATPIKPDSLIPALAGWGFTEPTYTQCPNEIIAALPWLTDPEIRILLVLIRDTLGYHRTTCQASFTDLQRSTGLGRAAVARTVKRLHAAGLITQIHRYPTSQWRLNITSNTHIRLTPGQPTQPPFDDRQLRLVAADTYLVSQGY